MSPESNSLTWKARQKSKEPWWHSKPKGPSLNLSSGPPKKTDEIHAKIIDATVNVAKSEYSGTKGLDKYAKTDAFKANAKAVGLEGNEDLFKKAIEWEIDGTLEKPPVSDPHIANNPSD